MSQLHKLYLTLLSSENGPEALKDRIASMKFELSMIKQAQQDSVRGE